MNSLKEIFIYPVKSLPGISVQECEIDERGPLYDRKWMLIDEKGNFLTQREHPKLTQISVKLEDEKLYFSHKSDQIKVQINDFTKKIQSKVWSDNIEILLHEGPVNDFFSEVIKTKCILSKHKEGNLRNPKHNQGLVNLSDKFPLLLVNEKSVEKVNKESGTSLTSYHFRPNLIFEDNHAFAEDQWGDFSISNVNFKSEEICSRCSMINVDPKTGEIDQTHLKALNKMRNINQGIRFGLLASPTSTGIIKVGDIIEKV